MTLDPKLIRDFAKLLNTNQNGSPDTQYMYGIMDYQGEEPFVQLDGAEVLTPVVETMDAIDGDRVIVMLKNHEAIVIGNITSPASARTATNFMDLTEEGLVIGAIDPTTHEPTGYHTRIDDDSFDVVNGDGDTIASFSQIVRLKFPSDMSKLTELWPGALKIHIPGSGVYQDDSSEFGLYTASLKNECYDGEGLNHLILNCSKSNDSGVEVELSKYPADGSHIMNKMTPDKILFQRRDYLWDPVSSQISIDLHTNPQAPSVDLMNSNGEASLMLNPSGRVTLTSKYGNVNRYFGIFPDNNTFHMNVAGFGDSEFKFRDGGGIEWNHTNSKNSNVNHFVITDDGKFQFNGINLMYYKNDTITLANSSKAYLCSGFLTGGNSSVRFTIPFNKILGASVTGVSVVGNITGRVRQNNKYILGDVSNPGTFTSPSVSLTANRDGVILLLTIPTGTGSINNDAVGIELNNLQLKFT